MWKKRLKRIPYDLISYIQIETEAIENLTDKQMIASYCMAKLEMVDWYIELLDTKNEKYIVPQNKETLVAIRKQLIECHKEIMKVKIKKQKNRPLIQIDYPEGYEG